MSEDVTYEVSEGVATLTLNDAARMNPLSQPIREGFMDVESDAVERVTGRKPRTLRSVCEQFRGAWPA